MIDIEKFICSLLADHPEGVAVRGDIHRALKEQGLEYKDGKIVPIEDKTELKESEDERIRKELIKETKGSEVRLFETVTNDEFITWLEKQGKQKPSEWNEEDYNVIEAIACHLDNTNNEGMGDTLRNIRDKYYKTSLQTNEHA